MTAPARAIPVQVFEAASSNIQRKYTASPTMTRLHNSRKFLKYGLGPVGCLPGRTQFLSRLGWKAIEDYVRGDEVAQWEPGGRLTWVEPEAYVKLPCESFLRFAGGPRLLMEVSDEHRMPLYQRDGRLVVKTAARVAEHPSRHTVPTTFAPEATGMPYSDAQLRLMVAVCRELQGKRFTPDWWQASAAQLALILEEVTQWDGHDGSSRLYYCSRHESDVDFIQYCAHACGLHGWAREVPAMQEHSRMYAVDISRANSSKGKVMLRGDNVKIDRVPSLDGFKYCFSVPSSFFLVRHEGRIFVTGNSGKSTGAGVMEILMRSFRQEPDAHGVRKSRWAIIRNSYPELKSTTIKTWELWVPPQVAPVVFSAPIKCDFKQDLADGTRVELEVLFLALDRSEDVNKLLSLELTSAYINEGREIPWEIVEALQGRVGRYPQLVEEEDGTMSGGATEPGIVVDSNAPHITHWLHTKFETGDVPAGWEKFEQPPAVFWDEALEKWVLNPDAENLKFLPDGYYERQLNGAEDTYIRVMLANQPGASRKGRPIFTLYNERHVAKTVILPERRWPLIVGLDFGLMPGCVIGQLTNRGIVITDEVPASDESLEDFLETYFLPLMAKRYPGYPIIGSGDPAGMGRSGNDKRTSFDVLIKFGIKAFPAYTNNFQTRKETVDHFLRRDGGLIVSPHCTHLREALSTGYVWKEARNSKGGVVDKADKNAFSHIADALQYLCLWAKYGYRPKSVIKNNQPKTMIV